MRLILDLLRKAARRVPAWVRFQDIRRMGWRLVWDRWRQGRRVLYTAPVRTDPPGADWPACEVHVLTWQQDYRMALWATKSFYFCAGVSWPLVWHQGGPLRPSSRRALSVHFPDSKFLSRVEADARVEQELAARRLLHCQRARRVSVMLLKLIDCLLLSRADYLLILDSDVLFFGYPEELIEAVRTGRPDALFNRDTRSSYSLAPEATRARYGIAPFPELNAGLGLVRRAAWRLDLVERYLADPDILREPWLTEQTTNALLAAGADAALLPDTYALSISPGLTSPDGHPLVAKHYPSHPRPLFFREGIPHVSQLVPSLGTGR